MRKTRFKSRPAVLALGLVVAASITACSTGTNGSGSSSAPSAYSAASIKTFTSYTGAKAGAANNKLKPVYIGTVNADSGPGSTPELTRMTKAAVNLINTQLDGIDGHPVVLKTCDLNSEETGLSCGQQLANDSSILAVIQNAAQNGADSWHSVMDKSGIPIISALPVTPADATAPNSYDTSSGAFSAVGAMVAVTTKAYHAKSIALILPQGDPVATTVGAQLSATFKGLGLDVTQVNLASTDTDPTAALVAAGVTKADVILPAVVTPPSCLSVAKALGTLGVKAPVLALSSCASNVLSNALGDYPKWTYLFGFVNPEAPASSPAAAAQISAYNQWWRPQHETNIGVIPLQAALTLQRQILAGGGAKATRESVAAAAKAWKGPIFLGPQTVKYGVPPFIATPTLVGMQAYAYQGKGVFKTVLSGQWLGGGAPGGAPAGAPGGAPGSTTKP